MADLKIIEVPVQGMDCADCTRHVQHAIASLPGVETVNVFLASEKAVIHLDPTLVDLSAIRSAVAQAGYSIPDADKTQPRQRALQDFTRPVLTLLGVIFSVILFVIVVGEWMGFFETITSLVPWPVGLLVVLTAGWPVFRGVLRAALKGQVIAHTLMSLGVVAALAVGEWATAVVVVFFMRVGDYAEHFTTERARRAVKDLTELAPQTARLVEDGVETTVAVTQVKPGDFVIVRPGEQIPVDGEVVSGHATLNQASITGESMPVEAGPGAHVFAATLVSLGSLRVRVAQVGVDTTFGKIIRLVEEAEAHRAGVQRIADRFSAWYLPVVAGIAALTFIFRRDPLATAAVLVVACSCSFALATPIAMLASIGAAAKRGLMIKGGKYLESLARADVVLIDKTGTLTLGKPEIVGFTSFVGSDEATKNRLLRLAASAERYSEHPLAEALRLYARGKGQELFEPQDFEALPGIGVRARVDGSLVEIGSRRILIQAGPQLADELESQGYTLLFVLVDGTPAGLLAAADMLRPDVPAALGELRSLGIRHIELLTGDNILVAEALARQLDISFRAQLLPQDKIKIVQEYQAKAHVVVMIGDGVNDAPALAQADVGIAMGAAGSDIALEAAHLALMREDWSLVPQAFRIARRTLSVVKMNIAFTALYNLVGLSLAALGYIPPIFAAAAQSLPDLGILGNSARLLRQK